MKAVIEKSFAAFLFFYLYYLHMSEMFSIFAVLTNFVGAANSYILDLGVIFLPAHIMIVIL